MPGPFDFPRLGRQREDDPDAGVLAPDAGAKGSGRFNFPRLGDAGVTSGNAPARDASPRQAATDAPVAEPDVLDMLLSFSEGVTAGLAPKVAGVMDRAGDLFRDQPVYGSFGEAIDANDRNYAGPVRRHPVANFAGAVTLGTAGALAAGPSVPLQMGASALQSGVNEYARSENPGSALISTGTGAVGGLVGSYAGAGAGKLAGKALETGKRWFGPAAKSEGAALNEELLGLARAQSPRSARPSAWPPEYTPPPPETGATIPAPAGPPPPPHGGATRPPAGKPDLESAFPDEFPGQSVDDAWVQEFVSPPAQPPRPPPTELSQGPVPRARTPEGKMRFVPPGERGLRADAPPAQPTLPPPPLDIADPMPDFVGDAPVMSPPSRATWDPAAVRELAPPYSVGSPEPIPSVASRLRGGPLGRPPPSLPPPSATVANPDSIERVARIAGAVTNSNGRGFARLGRVANGALGMALGAADWPTNEGARALGTAGAAETYNRVLPHGSAQDRDDATAYAAPATTNYALSAVLSSEASGLSQVDQQALTDALVSGDDQKLRATDYRLRLSNPAYARAVERELRSYQEGD